jgi:predicted O-methyltransferase YrrM
MVERTQPQDERWAAVDRYIGEQLLGTDGALEAALAANAVARLPDIDVSPAQGRMLHLLARMSGARRILEIGTLGGYSTIELARALPDDGELVTLEIDPHHLDILTTLSGPFDLVFIDADKENNAPYVEHAIRLSRPGTTIIVDNVIREGGVLDAASADVRIQGTRKLFDMVSAHSRLTATAVQTIGAKKWDGFLLAIVDG